ncbi:MAG TPA: hypothetical protein VIL88_10885 [Devosia sp.]|jgi:predicted enzyme related to lactoylglutathione lyase|uniref:VOC family protein n=1 Tax=Devosia sp. TaxID=1871048 RepID=UPI002F953D55
MKVEGITWHAVVVPPEKFAAQRDFAINTLGLTIFMEMDQMIALSMPNGSMYEIYTPATVPPYGYNGNLAYGWRVDDVEAASKELAAAGNELLGEINRFPELKYAFRHFRAPDGLVYGINEQK